MVLEANQRVNVGGMIDAQGGTVNVDSQGANFSGTIHATSAQYAMNDGDTFLHGSFSGDQSWADNLNIFVDGNLTVDGNATITADADNNLSGNFVQNNGTTVTADGLGISGVNVSLASLVSDGDVTVNAGGAIIDNNGNTINVTAPSVHLNAGTDIGKGDPIESAIDQLFAHAGGNIGVNNKKNNLIVEDVYSSLGDIHLWTQGNIYLKSIVANGPNSYVDLKLSVAGGLSGAIIDANGDDLNLTALYAKTDVWY